MDNRGEDRGDRQRPARNSDKSTDRPAGSRDRRPEGGSRDGERRSNGDRKPWDGKPAGRPASNHADKPRFERNDRQGADRPSRDRNDRPGADRPPRDRNDRPGADRPPRDRNDRQGTDRAPRFERNDRPGGERPRFDRNDRQGGDRSPRFDKGDRSSRPAPRNRELAALQDLDDELLRLIMRRAGLLSRLRTGDRLDPGVEKAIRTSWEEKAARFSRDNRLARDLFSILQSVEPLSRKEEEQAFFNLAPRREPVDINLPAPAASMAARCWLALAAASGQKLELEGIPLTDSVIDTVKALNQIGGQLWWEENGTILSRGGKGLISGMDKVIHVGDDAFNLWLVLALCLGVPTRLKLTGGSALRFVDLAPLRHFLPDLGARLTNVIPAQDGLPARVECSGMLPNEIRLPADLPPAFGAALLLAAPFWERATRFILPTASPLADMAVLVLEGAGAAVRRDGLNITITPGTLTLPEKPRLPMDVPLAASILGIPAFIGGSVRLEGLWPSSALARNAETLLGAAGVSLTIENGFIAAQREVPSADAGPSIVLSLDQAASHALLDGESDLLPLASALAGAAALKGSTAFLPATFGNEDVENVVSGFLTRLGVQKDENGALSLIPQAEGEDAPAPYGAWICPDPLWAVGIALAAFARPNIHLSNPGVMTELYPAFWNLYNGLPKPDLTRKKAVEEEADVKPVRRRIIAQGVYGDIPPDTPAGDYY